jgi:steroid delta-isomerase-like uncharacterized protein
MSSDENKILACRFLRDIWSEGRMEVADEILAPDFVMTLGVKPFRVDGPEGLKGLATRNRAAFQGLNYDVDEQNMVAEEDRVIAPWTMSAKHVGQWGDSTPSNKDVSIKGMSFFRVADHKLTECKVQNEALSLLRQVGTLPPLGAPEFKTVEANKALVRRYIEELLIKENFAAAPQLVTERFQIERSALPGGIKGPAALHRQMDMLRAAFPDLELTIADLFAEGNKVAVRFEAPGTHTGEFMGIAPTGRKVTWRGIVIYQIEDGKVDHAWADWDDAGLIQALQ